MKAARAALTAAAPILWILLTERRTVADLRALPPGVDPNPPDGVRPWVLVGDVFSASDAELQRKLVTRRSSGTSALP